MEVIIKGPVASGKSTLANKLEEFLISEGYVVTRMPTRKDLVETEVLLVDVSTTKT